MRAAPAGNNYPPLQAVAPSRLRTPSAFARQVAPALGLRAVSVEQLIYGHTPIQYRFAALVGAAQRLGEHELFARLMAPVRAALAEYRPLLPLLEALHRAECADAAEQLADEDFREKLRNGTATPADARRWLTASRAARAAAEEAERPVEQWLAEQEGRDV